MCFMQDQKPFVIVRLRLKNKVQYIAECSGKIKNVFYVGPEALCNSAVTDQTFDIYEVNG